MSQPVVVVPLMVSNKIINGHGTSIVCLLNWMPSVNPNCRHCGQTCHYRGSQGHAPKTPAFMASPHFFLRGSSQWTLRGSLCFNFETVSLFHLNLEMSPGKTPDKVQLTVGLSQCPGSNAGGVQGPFSDLPSRLLKFNLKIHFLTDNGNTILSRYIQIDLKNEPNIPRSWESWTMLNSAFMSTETFLKMCQLKRKDRLGSVDIEEFEYVMTKLDLDFDLKEGNVPLKSSSCDKLPPSTKLYMNLSSRHANEEHNHQKIVAQVIGELVGKNKLEILKPDFKFTFGTLPPLPTNSGSETVGQGSIVFFGQSQPAISASPMDGVVSSEKSEEEATEDRKAVSEAVTSKPKAVELTQDLMKGRKKLVMDFGNTVTLKVGPELENSFVVHAHLLMQRSPVFEKMLTTNMSEKAQKKILLKDFGAETVQIFLQFLYKIDHVHGHGQGQRFTGDVAGLLNIMHLAHMYQFTEMLNDLTSIVVATPMDKLSVKCVLAIFEAGYLYDIPDLQFRATQWIKLNKEKMWSEMGGRNLQNFMQDKNKMLCTLLLELL